MSKTTTKYTARDLLTRLRARYPLPEWVLLEEVADGTGANKRRSADALALSTYPSRGCQLIGFEVKVSRGDVMRELKDPDKALSVQKRCDLWYLVAAPGIVTADEVPLTWGLLIAHGSGLKRAKEAKINRHAQASQWSRTFVASLVRNAFRSNPAESELEAARAEGFKRGEASAASSADYETLQTKRELVSLRGVVEAFEKESGVSLSRWTDLYRSKEQARKLKAAVALDPEKHLQNMDDLAERAERVAKQLREAVEKSREACTSSE